MADVKELNVNNTTYDIKAKSVVDTNSGKLFFWSGTKNQFDAIVSKDSNTLYEVEGYGVFLGTTQIAAGSSQLNNPFYFGQSMYSASEPNNASWLKSNGQWNSGSVYTSFYTWLLNIYNGSVTVDGVSVKADGDVSITDYDFVIDTVNTQFKLPTLNGSEDLPSSEYDDLILQTSGSTYTAPANGWYYLSKVAGINNAWVNLINVNMGVTAGRLAPISGDTFFEKIEALKGDVIQVSYNATGATNYFRFIYTQGNGSLYFYVGETVQDANVIAAGQALTDITNLKNATNFSDTGTSNIAGFAMPSNTYDDLTLGASGSTYTAPADGYFSLIKLSTAANQWLGMYCLKDGETTLAVNTHEYGVNCWTPTSGGCNGLLPIKKGRICAINYSLGGATEYFRFIYAKGSEWEKE